ncbi:Pkinase-domain-containing protein [Exidia glandulosa HHB12029]|uniref:non-specific serine/threonine protein kinase n=1 Tax=Exidia glandulosa HHB12029 TaxID=1314781 RepID=A0A165P1I5_EXIGL|nr:Pkinase-domain-containing protein [Exidia glandulosa HHB12029]
MSWRQAFSRSANRSTTPTPGAPDGADSGDDTANGSLNARVGLLTIRVIAARALAPTTLPPAVKSMLSSAQAKAVAAVSPSSVTLQRANMKKGHRAQDSVQRKNCWWLPYAVLEFDVNQVLIDAMGGQLSDPVYMYQAQFDVSRTSEISLQLYLRAGETSASSGQYDMGLNDQFIGGIKFVPALDGHQHEDLWYDLTGGTVAGQIQIGFHYEPENNRNLTIDSFELLTVIGKGSFGKVMQVRKRDTGRIYALKTIRKHHVASRNEIEHTLAERMVLARVNNPFIVPLKFSFQSETKLYLVLAFVNGGELFRHLQNEGRFNEERSRFYCAELLLALEHLHDFNVIYRDLKPENILLDYNGHIALCDFGLCKQNMTENDTTTTFCGTPEYLSPEIIQGAAYSKAVDWWTLGVLLYEMLCGLPPFYDGDSTDEMYKKILNDPLVFSDDVQPDARSVLKGLLTRDPTQRLGANGAGEIKAHPFFANHIDFKKLLAKRIQPPFKPSVASAVDTSNFDPQFTHEAPTDSVVESSEHLSETFQRKFADFSYDGSRLQASPA